MKIIPTILALALIPAGAYAGGYPDITIPELKSALTAGTVSVIDANGSASWQKGHIPRAIDFESCGGKLVTLLPQDKGALIVAYCGGPQCHAYEGAASAAEKLGYTNVRHLSAGITGWIKAGEPKEKGPLAVTDDETATPARNSVPAQSTIYGAMKDTVEDATSKIHLSRPASTLMFYGDLEAGCVATLGHTHCASGNGFSSGAYSQVNLGTDFRLGDGVSVGVQVQTIQCDRFR